MVDPSIAQLSARMRLALDRAYLVLERRGMPAMAKAVLKAIRPRLERSLAEDPRRAAAILVWAWARIPELLGDTVDLTDSARVWAIVRTVEEHELGEPPAPAAEDPDGRSDPGA